MTGITKYQEWILVRNVTVAGFATDADWHATQPQGGLLDGGDDPVPTFQIPSLNGHAAAGMAVMVVGVNAAGVPVAPGVLTASLELLEVVTTSEDNDGGQAIHVAEVADETGTAVALATFGLNTAQQLLVNPGGQAQFIWRVTAVAAAGITTLRILIRPVGA